MKKSKELLQKTGIISIGKISTQVISFFLLPLYTARLSTEDYGSFDLIATIATFFVPILTMLMEESMFRFLIDAENDEKAKEKIISQTFIFSFINGLILSGIAVLVCQILHYRYTVEFILYSTSCFLIAISNSLSRGLGKIKLYSLSNFVSSVLIVVLNLIFILGFNWGFNALLVSNVTANVVVALVVMFTLHAWKYISLRNFDKKMLIEMLRYSIPLVPNSISWAAINSSDRLFIVGYLGASANGLYSIANKFPGLINTFYGFFNLAWREVSAKIVKDNENEGINKIYRTIRNGMTSITIVLIACVKLVYPFFINEQYQSSVVYVPILAVAVYYLCISAFYGGIFTAYKDTKIIGSTSIVAAGINILIDLLLIEKIGIYAAAISTLAGSYFMYIYRKIKMKKYWNISLKGDLWNAPLFAAFVALSYVQNNLISVAIGALSIIISFLISKDAIMKFCRVGLNRLSQYRQHK